jgi:hypothetical protein
VITTETRLLLSDGAGWIATVRAVHLEELQREPTDYELAQHMAWVLEQQDGGWTADKMRDFVRSLDEWRWVHADDQT